MPNQELQDMIHDLMRVKVGDSFDLAGARWHRVNPKTFTVTSPKGVWEVLAAHHPLTMAIGFLTEP